MLFKVSSYKQKVVGGGGGVLWVLSYVSIALPYCRALKHIYFQNESLIALNKSKAYNL